ncbi:hypothetical protein BDV95DRAFT_211180 [Massariosphaeria phaeospora]|uniref:NAD(P)-binding protein n=1 Tax=Massariosphaeria phaeospora TaxID=100035 RepID=A0A7C8MFU1_9PLEO|nr:hypothetical protein BDV95DRAFT_211180 [Massariosphaeria phaeospora]
MTSEARKKYALITGCTPGGIGHYLSLEFAAHGFHVLSTVRDPSKYTSTPHPRITYLPLELSDRASIKQLHKTVSSITNGRLDVLYNNAGRNYVVPALDFTMAEVHDLFETNVFAVMQMCQEFVPLLIEAQGTIVATGSLAGLLPYVWGAPHNASKAALHAYVDTLRVELAPLGVRVVTVITGGVKSNLARVHRELPPGSYTFPLAPEYEQRLTHSQQLGMDTQQYARSCVNQVLKGDGWLLTQRWIWEGKMSWITWFIWSYWPTRVFDWWFSWEFKLHKLRGTVGNGKKTD